MRNKRLVVISEKPETTEEEQFAKALAKCRNCGHVKLTHSFLQSVRGKCIDANLSEKGKYTLCKCKGWASSDNLEYMEEVYEKKNRRLK